MENNQNNSCVKGKLTPWLIGLVVITLVVFGCLIFGVGRKDRKKLTDELMGFARGNGNAPAQNNFPTPPIGPTGSFHQIIDLIKPAVVGIQLPGAQPFLQVWPSKEGEGTQPLVGPNFQPQAFGANNFSMQCSNCGTVVTRLPGTSWRSTKCPNCGGTMFCPAQPQGLGLNTFLMPS